MGRRHRQRQKSDSVVDEILKHVKKSPKHKLWGIHSAAEYPLFGRMEYTDWYDTEKARDQAFNSKAKKKDFLVAGVKSRQITKVER